MAKKWRTKTKYKDSSLNPWFSIFGMKWFIIVLMWTKRTRTWKTHTYPNQKNRGKIGIWILTRCVCFFMALRHCWINFLLRTTHCHWKSFWIQMFIQTMQKHRSHSPTYSFTLSVLKSNRNSVYKKLVHQLNIHPWNIWDSFAFHRKYTKRCAKTTKLCAFIGSEEEGKNRSMNGTR